MQSETVETLTLWWILGHRGGKVRILCGAAFTANKRHWCDPDPHSRVSIVLLDERTRGDGGVVEDWFHFDTKISVF